MSRVVINESRLEDWVQMFKNEILTINPAEVRDKAKENNRNGQLQFVDFPEPYQEVLQKKVLCHIDGNNLDIFQYN